MIINILKKYWQYIVIGLLLIILFTRSCSNETPTTKIQKVFVPEVVDSIKKPRVTIHVKDEKDSVIYKPGVVIYTENPVNDKMAQELIQAMKDQDSLKVLRLYLKSIGEKEEINIYDDKNQTIEVYTKVRGELLDQKISKYTIKQKEISIQVPIKETRFAVYVGSTLNYSSEMKLNPSVQLGVQTSKRLIVTGSYGLDKSIQVGLLYKIKL